MPKAHSTNQICFHSHLRGLLEEKVVKGESRNLTEAAELVSRETELGIATIYRYMKPRPTIDAAVCKSLLEALQLSDLSQLFTLEPE